MKHKFAKKRAFEIGLAILAVLSLVGMILAGDDPRPRETIWGMVPALHFTSPFADAWNKVIYDLSLASIVSLFFYWLIVWLPEQRKRARIKRSFKTQYVAFKQDGIGIFLMLADGSYDASFPETLLDQKAFRDYFKTRVGDGQDRWDRVASKLEGYYLQLLLNRMESFRGEFVFVLNNLDIESDEALEFSKDFAKSISAFSIQIPGYDNKSLLRFLWTVFTGWNSDTGFLDRDFMESWIDEL